MRKRLFGSEAPNWKGGVIIRGSGYRAIYMPEHHRARKQGYVLEHISVWEKVHNKLLPKGWVIHHLNGIKTDNRPCNLIAMVAKKHDNFIPLLKKRIRELEAELNILQKALEDNQMIFRIREN